MFLKIGRFNDRESIDDFKIVFNIRKLVNYEEFINKNNLISFPKNGLPLCILRIDQILSILRILLFFINCTLDNFLRHLWMVARILEILRLEVLVLNVLKLGYY